MDTRERSRRIGEEDSGEEAGLAGEVAGLAEAVRSGASCCCCCC